MKDINELRAFLGEAMRGIKDGSLDVDRGRTIAQLAKEITDTVKVEVDLAKATDGDFKGTGYIDVDPSPLKMRRIK